MMNYIKDPLDYVNKIISRHKIRLDFAVSLLEKDNSSEKEKTLAYKILKNIYNKTDGKITNAIDEITDLSVDEYDNVKTLFDFLNTIDSWTLSEERKSFDRLEEVLNQYGRILKYMDFEEVKDEKDSHRQWSTYGT
jgi:hypothetical protein